MASIVQIKQAIKLCKAATDTDMAITPFVWGHRGIGKSSLVRQLCESESWGFIDMRAAQIEASDLRGLPAEDAIRNRTVYRPPADMPIGDLTPEQIKEMLDKIEDPEAKYMEYMRLQPRFKHGIVFLDELNRAQDDVQQAAFQLILDRRIGQYVLPLGWIVVAAGNFMEGSSYQTNSFMDAAFLSRFCHIILSGGPDSANDWAQFIATKYTNGDSVSHSDVIEVVMQNLTLLDGKVDGNLGFSVQPNRRGWEMVVRVLRAAETGEYDQLVVKSVISGIVGTEAAGLMDTARLPVKPTDLLKTGIKANIDKLRSLERNQMIGLIWGMVSHCKPKINEEKYARVCVDLMKWMCRGGRDKDIVAAFGRALMAGGVSSQVDTVRAAALTNPELLKIITGRGGVGPKQTTNKVFLDYIEADPELSELLKKTAWGTDPDD